MSTEVSAVTFREVLSNAIRYWEPRRLIYNGALLIVVVVAFVVGWPISKRAVAPESGLVIFILAVLANVAYCVAYVPDIAIQHSSFRNSWRRIRWLILLGGTLMACALTYLCVAGPFGLVEGNW